MQGQIAENTALANEARAKAEAAQATADSAFKDAALANNRINGLDEYETVKMIPVLFKLNSAMLDVAAIKTIDEASSTIFQRAMVPADRLLRFPLKLNKY